MGAKSILDSFFPQLRAEALFALFLELAVGTPSLKN
jgi:hypothetical protein